MTKQAAIKLFIERSNRARLTIGRIKKWDERKTLKQNAQKLGISLGSASTLSKNYRLFPKKYLPVDPQKVKMLMDQGFCYAEIGRIFKVTRQAIHFCARENQLLR